jgi:hypothetical protein
MSSSDTCERPRRLGASPRCSTPAAEIVATHASCRRRLHEQDLPVFALADAPADPALDPLVPHDDDVGTEVLGSREDHLRRFASREVRFCVNPILEACRAAFDTMSCASLSGLTDQRNSSGSAALWA